MKDFFVITFFIIIISYCLFSIVQIFFNCIVHNGLYNGTSLRILKKFMSSIANIKEFKEGTRIEFVEYIARILDLAVDQYDEIVIEVEERSQNTKAGIEFIFGEGHLEERQQSVTNLLISLEYKRKINELSEKEGITNSF